MAEHCDLTIAERYWEMGWVVVPDVFARAEVAAIAQLAEQLGWAELGGGEPSPLTVDRAQGVTAPRKVDWAFPKHEAFQRFVLDDRLNAVITTVLGHTPYLMRDQVFLKPARIGSPKPWHQDQPHLGCEPFDHVIAAWIALDDADEDNGCLRYVSGSHRGPVLDHAPMPGAEHHAIPDPHQAAQVDWSSIVAAPVPAGGVALHHPLTLHGSHPNRSPRPRRAYSTHWVAADVTCPHDQSLEWAYSRTVGAARHPVSAP